MRCVVIDQLGLLYQTTAVNPDVLHGWGTRNRDWQYGVSVQQEIAPRVAIEVSYNRRRVEQLLRHA